MANGNKYAILSAILVIYLTLLLKLIQVQKKVPNGLRFCNCCCAIDGD